MERRLGRLRGILATTVAATVMAVGTAVAAPVTPSQPGQPPPGAPGANGACGMKVRSVPSDMPVWVYQPTGSAPATIGGGWCDSPARPTIFIGHGFGATDPAMYAALIE